jgi:predicted  nucleic acid-binding Zn-ribbon protein
VKELHKVVQDIKVEEERIKRTQMEATMEMENLGKRSGITEVSISNRIKETEDRLSGVEDTIEDIDTTVKENSKQKKLLMQNIQEIRDTMKRLNLRMFGIENKDSQSKDLKMSSTKSKKRTSQLKESVGHKGTRSL